MRKFIVTIEGKNYEVGVQEVDSNAGDIITEIKTVSAPVATAAPAAKAAPAPTSGEKVESPFPGLIKELLVANGATVKKGQNILVLEAMKMDNDIASPCDGVVTFQVVKGANVDSNAILAVIG